MKSRCEIYIYAPFAFRCITNSLLDAAFIVGLFAKIIIELFYLKLNIVKLSKYINIFYVVKTE